MMVKHQILNILRKSFLSIGITSLNPSPSPSIISDLYPIQDSYHIVANSLSSTLILSKESDEPQSAPMKGTTQLDDDSQIIFRKGRQLELGGDYNEAQKYYEQVLEVEPLYVYAWSSLGNVMTAQGDLDGALKCYMKSLSLSPPREERAIVLLNKAAIEVSINRIEEALKDLEFAKRSGCDESKLAPLQAVAYSNIGDWQTANQIFSKVISTADRNALPWWLRYSMSLLETSRGMEAVAFLQRTINRYPYIEECNAFATALYSSLGSPLEARRYWDKLSEEEQIKYQNDDFLRTKLHWGEKSRTAMKSFLALKNRQTIQLPST